MNKFFRTLAKLASNSVFLLASPECQMRVVIRTLLMHHFHWWHLVELVFEGAFLTIAFLYTMRKK
jgi:hypothetical protein